MWSYVEVGVGVVAACLPTLKPIFDNRSLDSTVAIVRSQASLRSMNSNSCGRNPSNLMPDGFSGLELSPYDVSKQSHTYSYINGADSIHKLSTYPSKTILRKNERESGERSRIKFEGHCVATCQNYNSHMDTPDLCEINYALRLCRYVRILLSAQPGSVSPLL